jgi:hypothetical protein
LPWVPGLILTEYFKSGRVPSVREVNGEEPIFPKVAFCNFRLRGSQVFFPFSLFFVCV